MIPITLGEALDKTNNHGRYQIVLFTLCSLFTAQEVFHICLDLFTAKPLPWRWKDEIEEIERYSYPPCQSGTDRPWVYTQNSSVSIRSEFDLYCSPLKLSLIPASFFLGRVCGLLLFWSVSTRFGRRWPVICSIWANSIVSWLLSCSVSYEVYVILRALDGFTMEGFVTISYVLLMECINENKRQTFATQFRSLQGVGFMILSGAAYLSPNWKVTCLIMGVVITIHGAVASAFIPESPCWLLAQESESLVSEKELFLTTISLVVVWALLHLAEFILYFNVLFLPGNAFLNFILLGVCDIPGRALPVVLMDHWGRKPTLALWNLVAGFFLLVCCVDNNIVRSLFYLIAKLVLSGNIVLVKVYTNDLAPRSDYSNLYKYCQLTVRVVGCGVPFLLFLNYQYNVYWYIYAVAGGSVLLSTFFIFYLPETRGRAKPENVDQFLSLFYGSRFRPATQNYPNGHVITTKVVNQPAKSEGLVEPASSRTWAGREEVLRNSRYNIQTQNQGKQSEFLTRQEHNGDSQEYDLGLLSNTDFGNLSLYDPDIQKFQKLSPNLESTRLSEMSRSKPRELVRPKSLNLQRRAQRPTISRNPSYESSLNDTSTIMSATPDTSYQLITPETGDHLGKSGGQSSQNKEEVLKRNSLVAFTPKSSVRKDFFSLSRV